MNSRSVLETIQEAVAANLRTHPDLSGVDVLTRRQGNLISLIDNALAKLGLVIAVLPPIARVTSPNVPGPVFSEVDLALHVVQIPTTDEGQRSSLEVAEICLQALHQKQIVLPDGSQSLLIAAQNAIIPVDEAPSINLVQVNLRCSTALTCRQPE